MKSWDHVRPSSFCCHFGNGKIQFYKHYFLQSSNFDVFFVVYDLPIVYKLSVTRSIGYKR